MTEYELMEMARDVRRSGETVLRLPIRDWFECHGINPAHSKDLAEPNYVRYGVVIAVNQP